MSASPLAPGAGFSGQSQCLTPRTAVPDPGDTRARHRRSRIPYCGRAEPVMRELLADYGDVRYVWRHLPLGDVHPHAQLAAEAAEAAGEQGAYWEMHDLLLEHQGALQVTDLLRYAEEAGLDVEGFHKALRTRSGAAKVAEDVDSADLSGVSGTPTFFVNGRRHQGAYDIASLTAAVRAARERAVFVV